MKKVLLIAVLFASCTKTTNHKVSAVNGCVTCQTTISINNVSTGWKPFDTTICNCSDNVLAAYEANGNRSFLAYGYGTPQPTEKLTTICQ